jgi:hypothetical protein
MQKIQILVPSAIFELLAKQSIALNFGWSYTQIIPLLIICLSEIRLIIVSDVSLGKFLPA